MAFGDDAELLTEFVQWQAQKKVAGVDTTPAAFLIERAQQAAFSKILDAVEYLRDVDSGANLAHVVAQTLNILEL